MSAIFINGESGTIGGQFKKNATRFEEINGLEPKSIDHRGRARAVFHHALAHFELMRLIVDAPGDMMNAARPPSTASGRLHFLKINIGPGFSACHTVAMPAILRSEMGETHRVRKEGSCDN